MTSKLAETTWELICQETARGGDRRSADIINEALRKANVKAMLFDEIVNLVNQPCDDHVQRVANIQEILSTHECPNCHAKQFLISGAYGQCQFCDTCLTLELPETAK